MEVSALCFKENFCQLKEKKKKQTDTITTSKLFSSGTLLRTIWPNAQSLSSEDLFQTGKEGARMSFCWGRVEGVVGEGCS